MKSYYLDNKKKIDFELLHKFLIIFLILFTFLYFFKVGDFGLIDVDEPRYAEASREMVESGNYITPYFNYKVRYDKPVLIYWFQAFSYKVFGINELAARMPSVLAALLCLSMLYIFLSTTISEVVGLIGVLVLMTSFLFIFLSRFSTPDMILTSFISSSIFAFFLGYKNIVDSAKYFKDQIKKFEPWYLIAFLFVGLGLLAKGPVAIVIPGMVLFPFFWWIRKLQYFLKNFSFWIGSILLFIVSAPWYIAVHVATNGDFTKEFFGLHNFSRFTSVVSGHDASPVFFIPVVLIGFLPWSMFLIQAMIYSFQKGITRVEDYIKNQAILISLWWFLIVFIFFSASQTKLVSYVLPLSPAFASLIAVWAWGVLKKEVDCKEAAIGLGVFFILSIAVLLICFLKMDLILPDDVKGVSAEIPIILISFLLFVGVSMSWASSNKNFATSLKILFSTMFLFYFLFLQFVFPKIDLHTQSMIREFATTLPRETIILQHHAVKPSLAFYARRKVKKMRKEKHVQRLLDSENKVAFVARKSRLKNLNLENSYKWGENSHLVFYTNFPTKKTEEKISSLMIK